MGAKCSSLFSAFSYSIPRVVRIRSKWIFFSYFVLNLLVLGLISGYFVVYNKGYLEEDSVESVVTTKLYGIANTGNPDQYIWDNADYMVPPKENGAVTLITNLLTTNNQTQGVCEESPKIKAGLCETDADCPANTFVHRGNGERTGKCLISTLKPGNKVCEIRAWCPVEFDDPSKRAYLADENFTISIRNNAKFPKFNINRQNIPNDMDHEEMYECRYDPKHPRNKHCPMFNIGTVVKETGNSFDAVRDEGAVVEIIITWDCYFGIVSSDECLPTYAFHRLDRMDHNQTKGFHMRFSEHYHNRNGQLMRTLYRGYGIRLKIVVYGKGFRFGTVKTLKSFGSGLGYFGIANTVFAFLVLFCYQNRQAGLLTEEARTDEERHRDDLVEVHVHLDRTQRNVDDRRELTSYEEATVNQSPDA